MHCNHFQKLPISRREMLRTCANGFGALALTTLLAEEALAFNPRTKIQNPKSPVPNTQHPTPRAKNATFLFMDGGPSQVDTFDPKPRLEKEHGQPIKAKVQPTQFDNVGKVLNSPWEFKQHGQSGIPVSSLFPHVAQCVDDM